MANKPVAEVVRVVKRRFWSQADGRVIVAAWRRSGQKQADFGRCYGINAKRLSWWIRQVERGGLTKVQFHPVRMLPRPIERTGDDRMEIRLGDGRSVHVPAGFAVEVLERVLQLLEARV